MLHLISQQQERYISVRLYFWVLTGILATTHECHKQDSAISIPKTPAIQIFVFSYRYQVMLFLGNMILSRR